MARLSPTRLDFAASLGMFAYASSVVATPIILLEMARDLSFGLADGGGIEAVRAVFLLAVLIASGTAAARFGKTATLAAGAAVLAAGLFTYALAPVYVAVLAAVVLVGLGGGILEALLNPLVLDEHPDDSGRYLNIVNAFFSGGVLVSVLVVGDLLTRGVSWRVLVAFVGVPALASALMFVVFRRRGHKERVRRRRIDLATDARFILRHPAFKLYAVAMFCGGGAEGAVTFWSATYVQLHFQTLPRAGAFATAFFAAGMVVGRLLFGRFVHQDGLRILIILSALVGAGVSFVAWAAAGVGAFYAVIFCAGLSIACFWPSIQSHAATIIREDATMLFILLSCAGIPGFGLTSWIMGLIAEAASLRTSLLVIPVLLAILTLVMILSPRRKGAR